MPAAGAFVLLWATGFVVARSVVPHADPVLFLAVRFLATAALLAGIAVLARARWPAGRAGWRDALVAGALLHGLYLGGVFWGVARGVPAGIAALVASCQPLLTAALAGPLLGERVGARRWIGIAVGFAGAGLVVLPKLDPAGAGGAIPPAALAACLAGTAALTLGTLWQKRRGGRADPRAEACVHFLGGALVAIPLTLALGEARFDGSGALWLVLAWSVLGLSVGAVLLLLGLIRRGAVAGVAALFFLVPPVAAVMAYLGFDETLTPLQGVGMAVAALGVAVASRDRRG